jgi:alpha-N-arabinofuranosidase
VAVATKVPELNVTGLAGAARLPGLSSSASIRDRRLTLTVTNPSLRDAVAVRARLADRGRISEARATVLTHSDMRATNTFRQPDEVKPAALAARVQSGAVELSVPKQSVVAVEVVIG